MSRFCHRDFVEATHTESLAIRGDSQNVEVALR